VSCSVVLSKTSTVHFTVTNARLRPTLFALPGFITAASGHQVGGEYIYLSQWFCLTVQFEFLTSQAENAQWPSLVDSSIKEGSKGEFKGGGTEG
jgi:hypothetical protein